MSSIINSFRNKNTKQQVCRKFKRFYPDLRPIIYGLSKYTSSNYTYNLIYVTGTNFFPDDSTRIDFGPFKNLPVTFYSSSNISFVVPIEGVPGAFNVNATNNVNNACFLLYSNSIQYTIT